jgi:hypothetical protein
MRQARYEIVEDDGAFYGEIPAIPGVLANTKTLEALPGRAGGRFGGMGAGRHCRSLRDSGH